MINVSDLTFFTNEEGQKLEDRFKKTLKSVKYFDILVGYFRTSGFYRLYSTAQDIIEKKRIDILASEDKVKDIKDNKDFIDIHLSKELSNKDGIGVVLFEKANELDYKNINLSFNKDNIRIRIRKLNTNWVFYIKEILQAI